ncbi:MAG: hypothetical protein KDE28_23445 [Anaerolineales bacterium]|nr:hypothetical protein [Anaerolineales bacterium]
MALDILETLKSLKPVYRGAIFLTYTLDLMFFEELVQPKLDALGCTNVLILADQHGYDEALARGSRHLRRVGRQYVCAPVHKAKPGVQHAKAMLLVGPTDGLLLVGSGNLTLPGIGRNLEQFASFTFNTTQVSKVTDRYALHAIWQLIQAMSGEIGLSRTAYERLQAIGEQATWINEPVPAPANFRVWHSLRQPIIEQWRDRQKCAELRLISPYWTTEATNRLIERFDPGSIRIGLNAADSRLNGSALTEKCEYEGRDLAIFNIDDQGQRHRFLHAKTFIGKQNESSWCLFGSANCTTPGLLESWTGDGNLELVIWQQADRPNQFDDIWQDPLIRLAPVNSDQLSPQETEPFPTAAIHPFRLIDLSYQNLGIRGQIAWREGVMPIQGAWFLELTGETERLAVNVDELGQFFLTFSEGLKGIGAARIGLKSDEQETLYSQFAWIDQPDELQRFGHRSYHARVQASIQTLAGAGQMFEELMNFLWERVDPNSIHEEGNQFRRRRQRNQNNDEQNQEDNTQTAPPIDDFITDETLAAHLAWHVEGYAPHQQSITSLRDLLSIVLLRLTTETNLPDVDVADDEEVDDEQRAAELQRIQKERQSILQKLCDYLKRYCGRYARSLMDPRFLQKIGPTLLFDNHYTLGRILFEFYDKVNIFTQPDLRRTVMQIYCPLFWPEALGQEGTLAWIQLKELFELQYDLTQVWNNAHLGPMTITLIDEAWGRPPELERAVYQLSAVRQFQLGRELTQRIEAHTDHPLWRSDAEPVVHKLDLLGFRTLGSLVEEESEYDLSAAVENVGNIRKYLTPGKEKHKLLFAWLQVKSRSQNDMATINQWRQQLLQTDMRDPLHTIESLGPRGRVFTITGDDANCGYCNIRLPHTALNRLRKYQLIMCPNCRKSALIWEPALAIPIQQ